jgi:hypothetical protein
MNIQLFLNKKGLIHGSNYNRIRCDVDGTLLIGGAEITVKAYEDCVLPTLFYGSSGEWDATFKTKDGITYDLGKVAVRNGRILSPPSHMVELMELHCRADKAETERDAIKRDVEELKQIFDTNSLNFIIKGEK